MDGLVRRADAEHTDVVDALVNDVRITVNVRMATSDERGWRGGRHARVRDCHYTGVQMAAVGRPPDLIDITGPHIVRGQRDPCPPVNGWTERQAPWRIRDSQRSPRHALARSSAQILTTQLDSRREVVSSAKVRSQLDQNFVHMGSGPTVQAEVKGERARQ